jgi:hypothetical protein
MYIKRLLCMVRASYRLATLLLPFGGSTPGNAKHFLPSGLLPASGGEISNHRKCALVLVGLALSDLACFTGVVVSSGFVTQRVLALHARATRHLRARRARATRHLRRRGGNVVTWSMSFKPLSRSRPPINLTALPATDRRPKRRRR